ncbi:MAG: hypothetical protein HY561_08965 [Gemmatimonadetes bacterium]|nr:hypothetical protein [Gemmatimonadota bacterium]
MTRVPRIPGRLLSLAIAAAFLLAATGEAYGYTACPYHDAVPGSAAPPGAARAAHGSAGSPGGAHAGSPHSTASHGAPSQSGGHSGCTCVGLCQASAGPAAPVLAGPGPLFLPPGAASVAPVEAGSTGPASFAYLLPYPTGPPPTC